MGFPRQEYWSGLPFPPPGHLPDPVTELVSPMSPALAGGFLTTKPPGKSYMLAYYHTMQFLSLSSCGQIAQCVCTYNSDWRLSYSYSYHMTIMQGPLLIYTSPFSSDPHSYPLPPQTPTLMNMIDTLNCVCVYVKCMLFYMHSIYTNTIVLCYKSCSISYALFHTRSAWVALFTSSTSDLFPSLMTRS